MNLDEYLRKLAKDEEKTRFYRERCQEADLLDEAVERLQVYDELIADDKVAENAALEDDRLAADACVAARAVTKYRAALRAAVKREINLLNRRDYL